VKQLFTDRELSYSATVKQSAGMYPIVTTVRIEGAPLTDEFASELRNTFMQAHSHMRVTSELHKEGIDLRVMSPKLQGSRNVHQHFVGMALAMKARVILMDDAMTAS